MLKALLSRLAGNKPVIGSMPRPIPRPMSRKSLQIVGFATKIRRSKICKRSLLTGLVIGGVSCVTVTPCFLKLFLKNT